MLGLHDYFLYLCTRKHEDASTSKGCGSAKAKRACFRIRLALHLHSSIRKDKREAMTRCRSSQELIPLKTKERKSLWQ